MHFFWRAGCGEMVGSEAYESFAFREHQGWQKACRDGLTNGALTLCLLQGPCVCHQSRFFSWADNPTAGRKSPSKENVLVLTVAIQSHLCSKVWFLGYITLLFFSKRGSVTISRKYFCVSDFKLEVVIYSYCCILLLSFYVYRFWD